MPNLLSSLTLSVPPTADGALAAGTTPLSDNLSTESEGSSGFSGLMANVSQELGETPAAMSQWIADGEITLAELPPGLPLAGNLLPLEDGLIPVEGEEALAATSLQQWLAALPNISIKTDGALPEAKFVTDPLPLNLEGGRPQLAQWIRSGLLPGAGSLPATGLHPAVAAESAATAVNQLLGSATAGDELLMPQISGKTLDQAISQALLGTGTGKPAGQGTQALLETLATLPGSGIPAAPVATPMSSPVTVTGAGLTFSIDVPPGQAGWGEALGEKVSWLMQNNQTSAQVRLNPPHLGPMEIKVAMTSDQASVTFTVHHQVTAEHLESALPRLREMLADSGLQLAHLDVRQQGQDAQGQASEGGSTGLGDDSEAESALGGESLAGDENRILHNGLLDTYA